MTHCKRQNQWCTTSRKGFLFAVIDTIAIIRIDWPVFSRCSHSTNVVIKSSLQEYGGNFSVWPNLVPRALFPGFVCGPTSKARKKASWGRVCVWHPRKSQEQNALITAQCWYKLGIRVNTRSHRLNKTKCNLVPMAFSLPWERGWTKWLPVDRSPSNPAVDHSI